MDAAVAPDGGGGEGGGGGGATLPPPPTNPLVTALLTDMYQLTMAYAYWKAGKAHDDAVFDLFFRRSPFQGEYTVFAGLEECVRFAAHFSFQPDDLRYLRQEAFFDYLAALDCSGVRIDAVPEGYIVFPRTPLIRASGPLLVVQLLETHFLTLVNYASLVATNAARYRRVAGPKKVLLEFGLRRAQGPDGGLSASRYTYVGGCDATSNVEAGRRFGIPVRGTHSHAFVSSFMSLDEVASRPLPSAHGSHECSDFAASACGWLAKMQANSELNHQFSETNASELASFVAYALAFPTSFQALVDTYDVMRSGVPNFCAVALALHELGYKSIGVRLDSGDLSYQSQQTRAFFQAASAAFSDPALASIDGHVCEGHNVLTQHGCGVGVEQGHEIDVFGIGTHLVTCYRQPALGCVYKLVELNGRPRIKLSEDVTIPGKKRLYRLYGREGFALVDLLIGETDAPPKAGERILCRHPFLESKRAHVVPSRVEPLHHTYWAGGGVAEQLPSLEEVRATCARQLAAVRPDHLRALNPTPYKVSVSDSLYDFIHHLWLSEAPVGELT
eukprot:SM000174S03375  [mRNA]  locus=s174:284829:288763:- [translate_table: standard]